MKELIAKFLRNIRLQEEDDRDVLHLNAYDNQMSLTARSILSSPLSHRYNLGTLDSHGQTDPASMGEFLFKGLTYIYELEKIAENKASEMFHSVATDFRPLSGMHGMIATMATMTEPGDLVYSVECDYGGHFATRHVATRLGRRSEYIPVDVENLSIDLDKFADEIKSKPPKMIYFDIGCAMYPLPVKEVRDIVGPGVVIVYDASHTQGLIAGGEFQVPLKEGADILQGNTHKTFPGPQKAMIHFREKKYAEKLKESLTFGLVSSQHTHHSIALYITVLEMAEYGREYARQMITNAKVLAGELVSNGIELLDRDGEYTRSNVILIKGDSVGGHVDACRKLYECNMATNSRHGFGYEVIRIGVQEATRRGMKEGEMKLVASFIKRALLDKEPSDLLKKEVIDFNSRFKEIHYSFDREFGLSEEQITPKRL